MLYCPKCNSKYEDGVQRFCSNDGVRLISDSSSLNQPKSIFTNALKKISANNETSKTFSRVPVLPDLGETAEENFLPAVAEENSLAGASVEDNDSILELDPPIAAAKNNSPAAKPAARLINPSEIPTGTASVGNRAVNPVGRPALTWNTPEVLIGQTIKGRYVITEKFGEDEAGIVYLAEDKIAGNRKAVVRVLMEENADDAAAKILSEERVSLSHVNHPNIANLFDSGELLEGIPFIVTEYIAGDSLEKILNSSGQFNTQRTARIVRQIAAALGEAHQNGIFHRNLKPENIILGVTESGAEQAKVTDFSVFDGFEGQSAENIVYLSPEQLEEKNPSAASDVYSLAVIAYQMLTGRLPFNTSSEKELLRAQKEGLSLLPTNTRGDIEPLVDGILEKALAYNSAERYQKARDFGDAFFNALTTTAPWKEEKNKRPATSKKENFVEDQKSPAFSESNAKSFLIEEKESANVPKISGRADESESKIVKATDDLAWEKRSPEPIKPMNLWRIGSLVLGMVLLIAGTWAVWNYFRSRPAQTVYVAPPAEAGSQANPATPENSRPEEEKSTIEVEVPPQPRTIAQPADTEFFQNSKENLKGDLAKNFRGFSFYYPKDWVKNQSTTSFADVARIGATGTPIEQMIVTYYESKGTMTEDSEKFPRLVQETNKKFSNLISDYRPVSQGETTINNGWKVYELKFQGSGKTTNGDTITLWGRCLWIPAARLGVKTGFVITMLATSNSPEVKSTEDVGVKGELAKVLETFEPAPLDTSY